MGRFSYQFFKEKTIPLNPYECNDQPVKLAAQHSGFLQGRDNVLMDGTTVTAETLRDEGTLHVVFTVGIFGNHRHYNPPLYIPHFTTTHFQYRPNIDLPVNNRLARASSEPINQSDDFIMRAILQSIMYKIQ